MNSNKNKIAVGSKVTLKPSADLRLAPEGHNDSGVVVEIDRTKAFVGTMALVDWRSGIRKWASARDLKAVGSE